MGPRNVAGFDGLGKISEFWWKLVNEVGPSSSIGNVDFRY
jgi:hypothetical protein